MYFCESRTEITRNEILGWNEMLEKYVVVIWGKKKNLIRVLSSSD